MTRPLDAAIIDIRTIAEDVAALAGQADGPALRRRLRRHADALKAALRDPAGDTEDAIQASVDLADRYLQLGDRKRSLACLEAVRGACRRGLCSAAAAAAMKQAGRLYRSRGLWDEALAAYDTALSIYAEQDDEQGLADIENSLGIANFEKGRWEESERHYLRALDLIGDEAFALRAKINNNLGALYNARGETDKAVNSYLRSIPDFQLAGNQLGLAQAYHNLGMSFAARSDWASAGEYYDKSIEISESLDARELTALTYLNLADLHVKTASPLPAEEYCRLAEAMLAELDDRLGLAEAHKILGAVAALKRDWDAARSHFERSIALNEECSSPLGLAEAYYEFGRMCRDADRTEEAHSLLGRSLVLFERLQAARDAESVRGEVAKIEKLYLDVIEALSSAVENKDHYTQGHSSRVAHISLRLVEALRLDEATARGVVIAAYLHDVGKITTPDTILNKPGKLTEAEYDQIKRHPEAGVASLGDVQFPWPVKQYILHHHERYDGSGYPGRLQGDEIPIGARIIALADFFDALTTDRSYRRAWSQEQAVDIIRKNRGVLFDPHLTDCFLALVEQRIIEAAPESRFSMADLWKQCTQLGVPVPAV
ncbi:MAG: tetratricopeptide repeat protein [Candidatus Krumholzibacteriota bacterium]|nr:tetratricopeptide repeat protein [Candidatus Krumholzibacteriota bacterium]